MKRFSLLLQNIRQNIHLLILHFFQGKGADHHYAAASKEGQAYRTLPLQLRRHCITLAGKEEAGRAHKRKSQQYAPGSHYGNA